MGHPTLLRRAPALALVPVLILLAACGIKPRAADRSLGPRAHVVTAERIAASGATTMWEALQRTVPSTVFTETAEGRPARIRKRGASTVHLYEDMPIFVDHVQIGDIQALAERPALHIERIEVLSGIDATTYYGTNAGDGVIHIFTRSR